MKNWTMKWLGIESLNDRLNRLSICHDNLDLKSANRAEAVIEDFSNISIRINKLEKEQALFAQTMSTEIKNIRNIAEELKTLIPQTDAFLKGKIAQIHEDMEIHKMDLEKQVSSYAIKTSQSIEAICDEFIKILKAPKKPRGKNVSKSRKN